MATRRAIIAKQRRVETRNFVKKFVALGPECTRADVLEAVIDAFDDWLEPEHAGWSKDSPPYGGCDIDWSILRAARKAALPKRAPKPPRIRKRMLTDFLSTK